MEKIKVRFKLLNPFAKIPEYAYEDDAGLDVYSLEDYNLKIGERKIFYVGFALELPNGHVAIVKDKSSLPKNGGIHTMGGVFDCGYRGEYNVQLINLGDTNYQISKGDKLAQIIIFPIPQVSLEQADELSETQRGAKGFGSSGK